MWILYIVFVVICCCLTYKFTCYQFIKLDKINSKGFDIHQEFLSKAFDEIRQIKTDINQIKRDIYQ